MDIGSIANTGSTANANKSVNDVEKDRLQMQKDDFLKLMIESLKHQDPLKPMETNEMMAQMAQLTTVEQITNMSKSVEKLSEAVVGSQLQQASSLIGKTVTAMDGSQQVVGIPEKAMIKDNNVELLINGQKFQLGQITEITG